MFLPPDKLPVNKLDFINRELKDIISTSSEQKSNVNVKTLVFFKDSSKKSKVQDLLDSILKIAYPYISQARGLTDMNKQLEYSSNSEAGLKFCLLPEALPEGYEDKTQVILGFQNDLHGIKSVVKVYVWRSGKSVWYEHKAAMRYKIITSEAEPVDMEDAESSGPFTITLTGRPIKEFPSICGDFTLSGELHNGRPVYRNSKRQNLYSLRSGAWGVDYRVGDIEARLMSTDQAPSPALCEKWKYMYKYKATSPSKYKLLETGEISVTAKSK